MNPAHKKRLVALAATSAQLLCLNATSAQESETNANTTNWRAAVGVGAEYDSNVSVSEVDLSSGQGDHAYVLDLELGMKRNLGEKSSLSLSYDVSQINYHTFSRVDRLTHILGSDLSFDLGIGNAGISAYYIDARLDGEPFLRYTRFSPSFSGFISKRWFARGAYVYSEREVDERSQRNATTNTGEVDFYYFRRGLRSYFNLGYRYRSEQTETDELDFSGHGIKLRYIRRWDVFGRKAKTEIAARYEVRDYGNVDPTIGVPRDDERLSLKLNAEIPISQKISWELYFSHGDYESNLPRADFLQTIVGTRLEYAW